MARSTQCEHIKAVNLKTNKVEIYESVHLASVELGISRFRIRQYIKKGKPTPSGELLSHASDEEQVTKFIKRRRTLGQKMYPGKDEEAITDRKLEEAKLNKENTKANKEKVKVGEKILVSCGEVLVLEKYENFFLAQNGSSKECFYYSAVI